MTRIHVDCVFDARAATGEGAIWSGPEQVLYWVDIPAGRLHRHDPASNENRHWDLELPLGCFALKEGGGAVVALTTGFHDFSFDAGLGEKLSGPEPGEIGNRFNDGTVDSRGRFIAGTMPITGARLEDGPKGTLYSLDGSLHLRTLMDGFYTVNGLAFSPDGRTAYVSDSDRSIRSIWAYDYDLDSGDWSNKRVFFDTHGIDGRPDGGAMDADGCYWMAGVGGWQLARITPAGRLDRLIEMPVEKPTRIAFGGSRLDTLYVTSIGQGLDEHAAERQPQAGGLFALHVPGISGLPMPMMSLER